MSSSVALYKCLIRVLKATTTGVAEMIASGGESTERWNVPRRNIIKAIVPLFRVEHKNNRRQMEIGNGEAVAPPSAEYNVADGRGPSDLPVVMATRPPVDRDT